MNESDAFRNDGERRGMDFLASLGHRLVCRNFLTPDRRTEIDLITVCDGVLHFVEVKAWKRGNVHPLESQRPHRRLRVQRAARMFLSQRSSGRSGELEHIIKLCRADGPCDCIREVSFDLLWVKGDGYEYFERVF